MLSFTTVKINHDDQVKRLVFILLLLSFPIASPAQPQEVSEANVQNCRYMDMVEGSSGHGKKFDWQSFAKYSVLTQAEELGASHVVWERFTPIGAFNGVATAKVYNCNS